MPTAHVREAAGIPGTTTRTAFLCRDKPAMKEVLRAGGVACAESTAAASADEVREFIARVGYPIILKPRDGAGASGAARVDHDAELGPALRALGMDHPGRSVAVEEFIEGHEGFFDTLTLRGQVVHDFATHYYPNVLEAMRTRWISPQFITTNRIDSPGYAEVRALGKKVNARSASARRDAHGVVLGPKGLKFSEIGCRPPGVRAWISTRPRTTSTSTASGRWRSCTDGRASRCRADTCRHHRAPPRSRRTHRRLRGRRRHRARVRSVDLDAHLPRRARRRSRSRQVTWRTRGSG
jgi:hypothetical protein